MGFGTKTNTPKDEINWRLSRGAKGASTFRDDFALNGVWRGKSPFRRASWTILVAQIPPQTAIGGAKRRSQWWARRSSGEHAMEPIFWGISSTTNMHHLKSGAKFFDYYFDFPTRASAHDTCLKSAIFFYNYTPSTHFELLALTVSPIIPISYFLVKH